MGEYASGRSGPLGVGIWVQGEAVAATAEVRAAIRTLRNRVSLLLTDGTVVPLKADMSVSRLGDAERDTLRALCTVLVASKSKRRHLTDATRVSQLVRDLANGALPVLPETTRTRRSTVEIMSAMTAFGLRHPLGGRPLPDEPAPDVESIVDRVMAHISANPYAQGVMIGPELVEATVRRFHAEVASWPFAALSD